MKKISSTLALLLVSASLAACSSATTGSGGSGGSLGGGGSGGSGGSGGGSGGGSSGGSGGGGSGSGIQLFGLKSTYNKKLQTSTGVGPDIYEGSEVYVSDDTASTGAQTITGSLELDGGKLVDKVDATSTSSAGTVVTENGTVLPRANGTLRGDFVTSQTSDPATALDQMRVTSLDFDGDNDDDFFVVEQHLGYGYFSGTETITTMYGGKIAPTTALAGKQTAVYQRTRSEGGAEFQYKTGPGFSQEGATFTGDATVNANFDTGKVDVLIDNTQRQHGTKGPSQVGVELAGASINGSHFSGGTVRMFDESNGATISNLSPGSSDYSGAFFGDNAEHVGGVFQGNGTINGNTPGMVKGWFAASE